MSTRRRSPILWVIAAPASVAVWSGWVGLGQKAGWNEVEPFPGIADGFTFPSALLLPIGVEAYGLFAMSKWLSPATPERARKFAGWSALGALMVGALGQVCYHLLTAQGRTTAPDWVVVAVASLPVAVLGMAGLLTHLCAVQSGPAEASPALTVQSEPANQTGPDSQTGPAPMAQRVHPVQQTGPADQTPGPAPTVHPDRDRTGPKPVRTPKRAARTRTARPTDKEYLDHIHKLVTQGDLPANPSATRIQAALRISKTKAGLLRDLHATQADTPARTLAS